jgi:ribosomal protein S3AE
LTALITRRQSQRQSEIDVAAKVDPSVVEVFVAAPAPSTNAATRQREIRRVMG